MTDIYDNVLMLWDGEKVSDHNRQPLSVSVERIGADTRMANGRMRRNVVAKKHTFSTSWENLPSRADAATGPVDGGMTAEAMEAFFNSTDESFTLTLRAGDESTKTYTVMLTDFTKDIAKRGTGNDWWNISVTMVEV
jgi:hypothetical protein